MTEHQGLNVECNLKAILHVRTCYDALSLEYHQLRTIVCTIGLTRSSGGFYRIDIWWQDKFNSTPKCFTNCLNLYPTACT